MQRGICSVTHWLATLEFSVRGLPVLGATQRGSAVGDKVLRHRKDTRLQHGHNSFQAVTMDCSSHFVAWVPVSDFFFFGHLRQKQIKHLPKEEFYRLSHVSMAGKRHGHVSVAVNAWCHFHLNTQKCFFFFFQSTCTQTETDSFYLFPLSCLEAVRCT